MTNSPTINCRMESQVWPAKICAHKKPVWPDCENVSTVYSLTLPTFLSASLATIISLLSFVWRAWCISVYLCVGIKLYEGDKVFQNNVRFSLLKVTGLLTLVGIFISIRFLWKFVFFTPETGRLILSRVKHNTLVRRGTSQETAETYFYLKFTNVLESLSVSCVVTAMADYCSIFSVFY